MTTFLFHDKFSKHEKAILEKCGKNHAKELGIRDSDCTVTVRKENIGEKSRMAQMTQLGKGQFLLMLNENGYNLYDGISALGHELVHVRQYLQGHLQDVPGAVSWKGLHVPEIICDLCYRHMPWEVEAFDLQPKLHALALDKLAEREKFVVSMSAAAAKNFIGQLWQDTDS